MNEFALVSVAAPVATTVDSSVVMRELCPTNAPSTSVSKFWPLSVADVSVPAAAAMLVFVLAAAVAKIARVAVKFASVVTAAAATVVADVDVEAFAVTVD